MKALPNSRQEFLMFIYNCEINIDREVQGHGPDELADDGKLRKLIVATWPSRSVGGAVTALLSVATNGRDEKQKATKCITV